LALLHNSWSYPIFPSWLLANSMTTFASLYVIPQDSREADDDRKGRMVLNGANALRIRIEASP
jgi:hypothetical protein